MDEIGEFLDERQKMSCPHCGCSLSSTKATRDHVPTKTLLRAPFPANLPIVRICHDCNQQFGKDEQYLVALLSCALSGTSDPFKQMSESASRILNSNSELRNSIEASKREYRTPSGQTQIYWNPDHDRIRTVVVKNARGHALFEFGEAMHDEPAAVSITPLIHLSSEDRVEFENVVRDGVYPELGSRMMTRIFTGQDLIGDWVVLQDGIYRYAVTQSQGGMLVRSVMAEYLASEVWWD